jgi:hypothetical protein
MSFLKFKLSNRRIFCNQNIPAGNIRMVFDSEYSGEGKFIIGEGNLEINKRGFLEKGSVSVDVTNDNNLKTVGSINYFISEENEHKYSIETFLSNEISIPLFQSNLNNSVIILIFNIKFDFNNGVHYDDSIFHDTYWNPDKCNPIFADSISFCIEDIKLDI